MFEKFVPLFIIPFLAHFLFCCLANAVFNQEVGSLVVGMEVRG